MLFSNIFVTFEMVNCSLFSQGHVKGGAMGATAHSFGGP